MKINLRQVDDAVAFLALRDVKAIGGNGGIKNLVQIGHYGGDVRRTFTRTLSNRLSNRREAGDARGKLQDSRIGLHGLKERPYPSFLGEEVFAERVRGNQAFNGIDNLRQSLQTPCRNLLDLCQGNPMSATEGIHLNDRQKVPL